MIACPGIKKGEAGKKKKAPTIAPIKRPKTPMSRVKRKRKMKGFKTFLRSPTIVSTIPPSTEIPFLKVPLAEKEDPLKFFFWT